RDLAALPEVHPGLRPDVLRDSLSGARRNARAHHEYQVGNGRSEHVSRHLFRADIFHDRRDDRFPKAVGRRHRPSRRGLSAVAVRLRHLGRTRDLVHLFRGCQAAARALVDCERTAMEPQLREELAKMPVEPLLPIEKKLIDDLRMHPPKLAIFQTGVGTQALFATTDRLGATDDLREILAATSVAVRGPKPTAALRSRHVRIDLSARDPFTTHEVLEAVQSVAVKDARVVVQRYGVTNVELEDAM